MRLHPILSGKGGAHPYLFLLLIAESEQQTSSRLQQEIKLCVHLSAQTPTSTATCSFIQSCKLKMLKSSTIYHSTFCKTFNGGCAFHGFSHVSVKCLSSFPEEDTPYPVCFPIKKLFPGSLSMFFHPLFISLCVSKMPPLFLLIE